ncbi:hypothetical protein MSG28_015814 [Choristoneura fumiferana]|uniref:Uncharacterized protein n=1 Tax=Choristoneura fumiferana TaxID=7141 RepID=A0ACC0KBN6_CHOFU|nr:hypothetical protein MSG28_015814 [Choristoneura fumiferana]
MSWLNINQSLNSLKGQITNFASEVLSEVPGPESADNAAGGESSVKELEEKCHNQELELIRATRHPSRTTSLFGVHLLLTVCSTDGHRQVVFVWYKNFRVQYYEGCAESAVSQACGQRVVAKG